jgi:mannose-6-phosphate isomerase-like protein (cupin superfamily)
MSIDNLLDTFVVIGPDQSATPVKVTPSIFEELDRRFDAFKGRLLVARWDFTADWPTWEIHPHGDEVVLLISGAAEMILDHGGEHRVTVLSQTGAFVVVPKGTWHTARISTPTSMLFITPGEGTENRPV